MGSYLSEPVTEKISNDESNDNLSYGASSMQGWRVTQEDAHNCLLDFDNNCSLFAVYDGHGGHEVAQYCADKLPEFLKSLDAYKAGDVKKALIDGFLGFDATLITPEVIAILREIAGMKNGDEDESDEDEENVNHLKLEAAMSIEEVMEKYTNAANLTVAGLKEGGKQSPGSPLLKGKKTGESSGSGAGKVGGGEELAGGSGSGSSKSTEESSKNGDPAEKMEEDEAVVIEGDKSSGEKAEMKGDEVKIEENGVKIPEIKVHSPEKEEVGEVKKVEEVKKVDEVKKDEDVEKIEEVTKETVAPEHQNGEDKPEGKTEGEATNSQENGVISKKGKGKALAKTKPANPPPPTTTRPRRIKPTTLQLYSKLLENPSSASNPSSLNKPTSNSDEEEDSDSDDHTFLDPTDHTDDDDSEEEDVVNTCIELEDSEDDDDTDEEDDDSDADDEEEVDSDEVEEEEGLAFRHNVGGGGPGAESGCTAVVAVLVGCELYVANAGDSRCVVSRNGTAVEMSLDHKPEDPEERRRVRKAGGRVTADGRINNGLNLSRALGDHEYKQNKTLGDRDQMITALPDVRRLTVGRGTRDEFMVLACDGVWNYMTSQDVVDFVRSRLMEGEEEGKEGEKMTLSQICEEMFDHCLAPDTHGDGTGCDNMTAIIVQFKQFSLKRPSSPTSSPSTPPTAITESGDVSDVVAPPKRPKTELTPEDNTVPTEQ